VAAAPLTFSFESFGFRSPPMQFSFSWSRLCLFEIARRPLKSVGPDTTVFHSARPDVCQFSVPDALGVVEDGLHDFEISMANVALSFDG
jgi:hypothetical protein